MASHLEILLVEDNEGDVEMTERALRDMKPPCNLSVSHNGAEALAFLMKKGIFANAPTPALILADLNMPGMGGKHFLEVVKGELQLRAIPVVMLSSSESPRDIRECYDSHANCYAIKPFNGSEYMEKIREIVNFWRTVARLP